MSGVVHGICSAILYYSTSVGSTVQCLLINHCLYSNHWSLLKAVISMTDKCLLAGSSADTAPPTLTPAPVVTVTPSHGPGPSQVSPLSTALTTLVVLQQQYPGHINAH